MRSLLLLSEGKGHTFESCRVSAGPADRCWPHPLRSRRPCWYDCDDDGYLLTLGPWTMEPPPAPTWREFFISEGIPHQTEAEAERIWDRYGFGPEDYDKIVSEDYWWDRFEMQDGPWAKAYSLLRAVDVGPRLQSARGPLLEFHEGDCHPGDNMFRVTARDELSLSLLQARLIDLSMPIKVVEGD